MWTFNVLNIMELYRVFLCLTGLVGVAICCDTFHIEQCTDNFASDVGVSREKLQAGLTQNINRESLQRICNAYDSFEKCVKSYRGYCPTTTRVQMEGLEDLYDYVCGDGFEKHLKHVACLNSPSVEIGVLRCSAEASKEFDRFLLDKNDVCDIFKDSLDCTKKAVKSECGSEAAEHQVEIDRRYLQPLASEIDCDLGGGPNYALIIGFVVAAIITVILFVAVCLYCLRKKNRRRFDEENQQTQMNVVTQPGATAPNYPGTVVSPPEYNAYEDPSNMHSAKPPAYDNPTYTTPSDRGVDDHIYTGLPGKE